MSGSGKHPQVGAGFSRPFVSRPSVSRPFAVGSAFRRTFLFLAGLSLVLVAAPAHAQTRVPAAFLGTWASLGLNPGPPPLGAPATELPYEALDKKLAEFVTPWAQAQHDATEWNTDDTGQVCKLDGIFRQGHGTGAGNFRLVEATGNKLYQVWSSVDEHGLVRIYLNSPHPRNVPLTWNGDARGRFESDDTFVVDTVGFNAKSWLNSDRWVHSEELRVIERYRLYGGGQFIQLRVFIDDRLALKEPYTYTRYYRKVAEPTEGVESVCNENAPEDDLWAQRRDKLLDEHDAKFTAFMAKYAHEPLPGPAAASERGPAGAAPLATTSTNSASRGADVPASPKPPGEGGSGPRPNDSAKLRALAGIYEPVPNGMAIPGGLRSTGSLAELPLLPAAQATAKSRNLEFDPAKHCLVVGPFRMMARDDNRFELLTTENRVTMMFERISLGNKREIYLGRREHATKGDPTFLGDSIGRVEGDTLIVDTTRFNDATWLNDLGAPHSDALRLIERFRPVAGGRFLEYQVTAEDPKTLARPHTYTRYYQRSANELQEDFCEDRR